MAAAVPTLAGGKAAPAKRVEAKATVGLRAFASPPAPLWSDDAAVQLCTKLKPLLKPDSAVQKQVEAELKKARPP